MFKMPQYGLSLILGQTRSDLCPQCPTPEQDEAQSAPATIFHCYIATLLHHFIISSLHYYITSLIHYSTLAQE